MGARILVVDDSPTIRKVVAAILESREYEPILAEDGEDALQRLEDESVDLVLLDFVMPRMNGYQFCRELRASDRLKTLPVVLMSAKGDRIREQFVQQTGAIDAITKPFDARGLIAVVEGALSKREAGRGPPVPSVHEMPEDEALLELRHSKAPPEPGQSARVLAQIASDVSKRLAPELLKLRLLPAQSEARLLEAVERALTQEVVTSIAARAEQLESSVGREALAGDIAVISIAEILQMLQMQRQTGSLEVSLREQRVTLYVGDGNLDFASAHGLRDEFLLGRYLVRERLVSREALDRVLSRSEPGRLLGQRLIDQNLVNAEQVRRALQAQTSELVYEVVRWNRGRFTFRVGDVSPAAAGAKLGLGIGGLVMEGFRRVDEWRLIEGTFDFEEVLYRDQGAIDRIESESELTGQERAVLAAIDGERTVREIVDEVQGSSFELCKILYQLVNSRLVRRKAT